LPERDLKLLTDAAIAAGVIALKYFRADPENWDKGDNQGPVSVADLEIDRMLKAELRAARPDYGWLSEETEDTAERLDYDQVFIIDPIDGTRSFIAGHENFSHSLAIATGGVVTAAVVHLPAKDMTFTAFAGGGAFMNGEPISNSDRDTEEGARILAAKPMLVPELWNNDPPPIERHFRSSLAYRLCLVANGRFDGMLTLRPTWEWDIAAGDLIGQEAGAKVGTKRGEAPRYNNADPRVDGIISAAPVVYDGLLGRL